MHTMCNQETRSIHILWLIIGFIIPLASLNYSHWKLPQSDVFLCHYFTSECSSSFLIISMAIQCIFILYFYFAILVLDVFPICVISGLFRAFDVVTNQLEDHLLKQKEIKCISYQRTFNKAKNKEADLKEVVVYLLF